MSLRNAMGPIVGATILLASSVAMAGSNDIVLHRFGECQFDGDNCVAIGDEANFKRFARDLGLVFSPPLGTTAETLGQAGFSVQIDQTFSTIDAHEEHWRLADADEDPSGTLPITQLHIRKGLPMSLEIGGMLSVLWQSQLLAVGTELRWALHEDYLWPVPDLAVRGYVNTVLGHQHLQLTTTGVEIVTGLPIGVGNVMNITPFAGYNLGVIIAASRLIDATPGDPRPPEGDVGDADAHAPEFNFSPDPQVVHQGVAGLRFQFAVNNIAFQAQFSSHVQNYTLTYGLEF